MLALMNIRPGLLSDLPVLLALWRDKQALLAQTDPRFKTLTGDAEAAFRRWLADALCVVLVVTDEQERVVGYAVGTLPAGLVGAGLISDLALDLHTYQKGAARALLAALRDWFTAQQVSQVIALVPRRSVVEQAFWRGMGAVEWVDLLWL